MSKLGPYAQNALVSKSPDESVSIFIRTKTDITTEQEAQIVALGGQVYSKIGTVNTGRTTFGQLEVIAALDFVESVDIGSPLYPN